MDATTIERGLEFFPLELLELRDRHQVLFGSDAFLDVFDVKEPHVRLELGEQLHGKVMHLMAAYLEAGDSGRRLRRLLLDSLPGFVPMLRGLLLLRGGPSEPRPADPLELTLAVEQRLGVMLPAFRRIENVRRGQERLERTQLEPLFDTYLEDARRLEALTEQA
jgi:hypothetical protein